MQAGHEFHDFSQFWSRNIKNQSMQTYELKQQQSLASIQLLHVGNISHFSN
jgi:hypothetical protein